jgi:Domain of Unknown Function (DUF1206)
MERDPAAAAAAPIKQARSTGEDITRTRTFEMLARAGIFVRGVIYAIIGLLAIKLALGDGGETTNQNGALKTIAEQPFGKVLLILTAVGLAGYGIWRLARAALGHGREDSDDFKERIDALASGIGYLILCITAISILVGSGADSGSPKEQTGGVLGWPAGQLIVGAIGVVVIGAGLQQGWKGLTRSFLESSKTEQMSEPMRRGFTALGVFGHFARMVVFVLIGWFFIRAAIDFDPDEAVSLDGALTALGQASYGPLVLGIVAAGLMGFAAYSMVDARYRRV